MRIALTGSAGPPPFTKKLITIVRTVLCVTHVIDDVYTDPAKSDEIIIITRHRARRTRQ